MKREPEPKKVGGGVRLVHSPSLLKKTCPICKHNKAWPSRNMFPTYKAKCTRCGHKWGVNE